MNIMIIITIIILIIIIFTISPSSSSFQDGLQGLAVDLSLCFLI
jgi:hypothetical protein